MAAWMVAWMELELVVGMDFVMVACLVDKKEFCSAAGMVDSMVDLMAS